MGRRGRVILDVLSGKLMEPYGDAYWATKGLVGSSGMEMVI